MIDSNNYGVMFANSSGERHPLIAFRHVLASEQVLRSKPLRDRGKLGAVASGIKTEAHPGMLLIMARCGVRLRRPGLILQMIRSNLDLMIWSGTVTRPNSALHSVKLVRPRVAGL